MELESLMVTGGNWSPAGKVNVVISVCGENDGGSFRAKKRKTAIENKY